MKAWQQINDLFHKTGLDKLIYEPGERPRRAIALGIGQEHLPEAESQTWMCQVSLSSLVLRKDVGL